jgi:hypothetical protein
MTPSKTWAVFLAFLCGAPQEVPIPEIPKDRLPPRTRAKPDPATAQLVREAVYVKVSETAETKDGTRFQPEVPVVQNYLAEYFRRAGHPVVDRPEDAVYRIEGSVETTFDKELTLRNETIAWKYVGDARIVVLGKDGATLEKVEVPEEYRLNVKSEKSAVWDLRRYLAYLVYQRLFTEGKVFTNADVVRLINSLAADPFESAEETKANDVIQKLADLGLPAVPYLLDALTDTRTVLASAEYPRLENPSDLKVYHIADKALEEIFQKVSRMEIDTPDHWRFVIIRGWEREWARFCKPFRDSPEAKRRQELFHRKSEGAVEEANLRVLDVDLEKKAEAKDGTQKDDGKDPSGPGRGGGETGDGEGN